MSLAKFHAYLHPSAVSLRKDTDKCVHIVYTSIIESGLRFFFLVPIGVASPLATLYFDGLFVARMRRTTKIVVLAYVVRPHAFQCTQKVTWVYGRFAFGANKSTVRLRASSVFCDALFYTVARILRKRVSAARIDLRHHQRIHII